MFGGRKLHDDRQTPLREVIVEELDDQNVAEFVGRKCRAIVNRAERIVQEADHRKRPTYRIFNGGDRPR